MEKRKVVLVLMAVFCAYLVGAGGILPILTSDATLGEVLTRPLANGSTFDIGLLMVVVLMLAWAFLLGPGGKALDRPTLLRGISLASAFVMTGCLFMNIQMSDTASVSELFGIVTLVAVAQGVIGCIAACLLLKQRESRSYGYLPLGLNSALMTVAIMLLCGFTL